MAAKRLTRPARFGGVRALKSGRFQARYKRDGRTYTAPDTFGSEADAWAWLTTIEADMHRGEWRPARNTSPTLAAYGAKWITTHPKLKATTAALYRADFDLHVEPYLGHLQLRELTPALIREWNARLRADLKADLAARHEAAVSKADARRKAARARGRDDAHVRAPRAATVRDGSATAARAYRLLRAILNTAVKDRELVENPCQLDGAADPDHDGGAAERPTLSAAEVDLLAREVPERYAALVLVLAWTGLRLGEACALRRDDVDLTPGRESVRVSERVYYVAGEGFDYGPPKSRAGRRRVPLSPHVAAALVEHLAAHVGPDGSDLVFATSSGAPAVLVAGPVITRRLDAMGRNDVRVHDLRHTGQVLAAIAGATQAELMRRMGHSSTVAAAAYAHTVEDHGRAVAEALSRVAAGESVVSLESRRRRARTAS